MSVPDGYREAVAADWETYSPMSEPEVRALLHLVADYDGREVTDSAVYVWGVESAAGNWDRELAQRAVEAFFARPRDGARLDPAFVTSRVARIRQAWAASADQLAPGVNDRRFWLFTLFVAGLGALAHTPWVWIALQLPPAVLLALALPVEFALWAGCVSVVKRLLARA